MTLRSLIGRTASTLLMLLGLAACGGGGGGSPQTFTIGGTVTGLASGTQIVMNNNNDDPALTVSADGAFTFAKAVAANGSYLVTINTQPTGQTCSVANFQGAGVTANVTNVNVTCSPVTHTVGGSVTGLAAGQQVVLKNNGADPTTVTADGAFTFAAPVPFNGSYAVIVGTQPTGQTCTVSNGSGSGVVANISDVAVTCSTNTFTVGVTVSGLTAGKQVTLQNNVSDPLTVTADGSATFATPVAFNGSYAVTVGTQPTGQTCTVANGSGSGVVANITDVTVTCSTNTFTIGGTISGLATGQQVTLNNNATDPKTVSANGAFTFTTPVTFNGAYAVTVATQPTGQTCTVSNGSGSGVVANISNVTVTCSTNTYTIGVTVSGLTAGKQVTLRNNGADPLTVLAAQNGVLQTFTTPVTFNSAYAITVATQPTGQTCTVSNGSGSGVVANVTNVTVTCSTNTYTIGVTVSGLTAGKQVTLNNNATDPKTVSANGAFTFTTPVTFNSSYAVTVGTQPVGQTCTVSNGSGSGVVANITNVTVTCSTNTYTIGVTVSGLTAGKQVTLRNNGADPLTVVADGSSTFSTPVAFNGSYAVTVGTQPTGQTCTVANGSGSGVVANITNVTVACSTNTYTIGVTVSGLTAGKQVTLKNNDADSLTVLAAQNDVLQTFTTPVTFNSSYAVTVGTQPTGQTCTVANGSGSGVVANITNVTVTCSTITFTISGTVSGLNAGQRVILQNNGANDATVTADGGFTFTTPVAYGSAYNVTVSTQPNVTGLPQQLCLVSNGAASNVTANVGNVSITCRVRVAYMVNGGSSNVQMFNLASDGSLIVIAGQPAATVGTGVGPSGIAIHPSGKYAYVADTNNGAVNSNSTVSQYSINDKGVMIPLNPVNISAGPVTKIIGGIGGLGRGPQVIAIDPSGRYAYVPNGTDNRVYQYTIDQTNGTLTPMNPASVATGPGGVGADIADAVVVSPNGKYVYVGSSLGMVVTTYSVDPIGGALTTIGTTSTVNWNTATGYFFTLDPSGKNLYTPFISTSPSSSSHIARYTVGNDGIPSLVGGFRDLPIANSGDFAIQSVTDPAGKYLYTVVQGCNCTLQHSISATDGSLTLKNTMSTWTGAFEIVIDSTGRYAYVTGSSFIAQYAINADGTFTPMTVPKVDTGSLSQIFAVW